jgi:hypothetical protein
MGMWSKRQYFTCKKVAAAEGGTGGWASFVLQLQDSTSTGSTTVYSRLQSTVYSLPSTVYHLQSIVYSLQSIVYSL